MQQLYAVAPENTEIKDITQKYFNSLLTINRPLF